MTSLVQYVLWLAGPATQLALIAVLWRRGLRRDYPIFFSYTAFEVLTVALQFTSHFLSYETYFYLYWVCASIGVGLGFAVIHEIFDQVFRPYESLRDLGGVLFKWAALVLVLVAVVSAAGSTATVGAKRVIEVVLTLDRSVRVMQCGLVLFLFLFSNFVGLSKRSHIFGVALGFGIFAAVDLSVVTLRSAFGLVGNAPFSILKSLAYDIACGLWFWYLRSPEPQRVIIDHRARGRDWDVALGTMTTPQESFLPMIETMVERVLERRESAAKVS